VDAKHRIKQRWPYHVLRISHELLGRNYGGKLRVNNNNNNNNINYILILLSKTFIWNSKIIYGHL
jgi:hypothetical protein